MMMTTPDQPIPHASPTHTPLVLIVRDGWGHNPNPEHDAFNAIKLANTPVNDRLKSEYPCTLVHTSGHDVGVPDGTTGNSEVGHQNIGAGRIVNQDSVRISKDIESGAFYKNEPLNTALQNVRQSGHNVHLLCICSDAGVHGRLEHLYACIESCKRQGLGSEQVQVHLMMDGRDSGPFTGQAFVEQVESQLQSIGIGRIASVVGRYWAMDRDNRWERVARAYRALTLQGDGGGTDDGLNPPTFATAQEAVQASYDCPMNEGMVGDEFIRPSMIGGDDESVQATRINTGDTVVFVNYRGDRPREIIRALIFPEFEGHVHGSPDTGKKGFDRGEFLDLQMVTMCEYETVLNDFVTVAYPRVVALEDIAGHYLSELGLRQFRCAETEKYPHVTFFFNDYREEPFDGERRQIVQSAQVATYDLQPEMSAYLVADAVYERLLDQDCEDVIVVNFANPDMVGHTGNLEAAIKAVEVVDFCVGKIAEETLRRNGSLVVVADHGNAEQMFDPTTNAPHTSHTLYDVHAIVVGRDFRNMKLREGGRLADLMPTALDMMGIIKPEAMTGESLLIR